MTCVLQPKNLVTYPFNVHSFTIVLGGHLWTKVLEKELYCMSLTLGNYGKNKPTWCENENKHLSTFLQKIETDESVQKEEAEQRDITDDELGTAAHRLATAMAHKHCKTSTI